MTAAGSNPFSLRFYTTIAVTLGCHGFLFTSALVTYLCSFRFFTMLAFGIMVNTSTKTKKTTGAANAATPAKRTRRAGNKKKAPVNKKHGDLNKD